MEEGKVVSPISMKNIDIFDFRESNHLPLPFCSSLSKIKKRFGNGMEMFFQFHLFLLFINLLLTIICIPCLFYFILFYFIYFILYFYSSYFYLFSRDYLFNILLENGQLFLNQKCLLYIFSWSVK